MSKYIKLEDAKDAIRKAYACLEDRCNINSVLNSLPTIEVSEDAISREDAVKAIAKQLGRMHDTNPEAWEDVAKLWLGDCK